MGAAEIVIIVLAVLIVVGFIAAYIARKVKGKPTGSCACCPYAKDCNHNCHSQGSGECRCEDDKQNE